MNRIVLGALAFTAASTLGNASESEDWAGLDKELETLRATMASSQSGSAVGASGFFRTSYLWSDDALGGGGTFPAHRLSGFSIDNIRLNLSATVDDFSVMLQFDASSKPQNGGAGFFPSTPSRAKVAGFGTPFAGVGGVDLVLDAYASWNIQDEFKLTVGQFRAPILRGALLDEDGLFFLNRSANDFLWARRDQGIMLSGDFEQVSYSVGVQNGGVGGVAPNGLAGDGAGDEIAYFGRVDFNAIGDGPGNVEGALGASSDTNVAVGMSYYHDRSLQDSIAWAMDATATFDIVSVSAELLSLDDAYNVSNNSELVWNVAGTVMVVPDKWEVGVRYEDFDDSFGPAGVSGNRADSNQWTFGVNHYINGTHNAKVSANYSHLHADGRSTIQDTDLFAVGLTLSW